MVTLHFGKIYHLFFIYIYIIFLFAVVILFAYSGVDIYLPKRRQLTYNLATPLLTYSLHFSYTKYIGTLVDEK